MEPVVRVDRLRVCYDSYEVFRDLSLEVLPGRIVAVVGPNGAGKTTLFRTLFGEIPKTDGSIRICGLDPFHLRDRRRLWSVARWVTDTPLLYPELTVGEFLEFSARAYGVPERAVEAVTRDIAMDLGLTDLMQRPIKQLSFGNQRKVHVAAGFFSGLNGPQVLVLDEPTVGLDPPSRLILAQVLRQYVKSGKLESDRSVLISSHNLAELSSVADWVLMLNEGRVLASGSIRELAGRYIEDLNYELVLFDDRSDELAAALQSAFDLDCQVVDRRTVAFVCPDARSVQDIVQYLARGENPFRVRELREELSTLERTFIRGMEEGAEA